MALNRQHSCSKSLTWAALRSAPWCALKDRPCLSWWGDVWKFISWTEKGTETPGEIGYFSTLVLERSTLHILQQRYIRPVSYRHSQWALSCLGTFSTIWNFTCAQNCNHSHSVTGKTQTNVVRIVKCNPEAYKEQAMMGEHQEAMNHQDAFFIEWSHWDFCRLLGTMA